MQKIPLVYDLVRKTQNSTRREKKNLSTNTSGRYSMV